MVKRKIPMTLKSFIKANAIPLIVTFFCLGVFIGLSGSVALILLSFFIGVFFGLKIQAGNLKNQFMKQAQELIIGEIPLIKLPSKRKKVQ
ncbi:hypothetical protein IM40_11295 (plasmid) [Candidatus Paracaedimonas acanthamoebae]|nr:hypothetical protein IM40_11295 [Candidatus Paracaedimonas acanthamoebae]